MHISVIIPTYKRSNDLTRLFESIYNQISIPNEIIVIVGPGDKESFAIAEAWSKKIPVKIIPAQKPSTVHALNLGLAESKEEIICLLDDDVWLPSDWSLKIIKAYHENKNLGAYGGRDRIQTDQNLSLVNPPLANIVGKFQWNGDLVGNHHCGAKNSPLMVDVLKGCNLSFRRSAFKKMQIDTLLESKGAETCWEIDICQQINLAGFQLIYDNENYVLHFIAQRLTFDDRSDLFSEAWSARVFNSALIMAKYRTLPEVLFSSLRGFLIGSRNVPGIVWSLLLISKHNIKVLKLPWIYAGSIINGASKGYALQKKGYL